MKSFARVIYCKLIYIFNIALSKLRIIHFKMKGIKIGKGCYIDKGVRMDGNISIGNNTIIGYCTTISTMPSARLVIGNDVMINSLSNIGASESVIIDDHCIFASFVHIGDATHGIDDKQELTRHSKITATPVKICKNVWLGSGVMVMKGVIIGEGSVIGAKALVNKSIPEYSIAVGIPGKVIKERI